VSFTLLAIYACGGDDGANAPDELTDASQPDSKLPAPETSSSSSGSDHYVPPADLGLSSLALGEGFGCIISADHAVYCWGRNDFGQLGVDPAKTSSTPTPVKVEGLKSIVAVTAGKDFACALDDEAHGWCWGNNSRNQVIARHGETMRFTPEIVTDGTAQIVAAGQHACILDTNGFLHCWGDNDCNLFGDNLNDAGTLGVVKVITPPMKHVSLGPDAMCAVSADKGEVYCWGADHEGSLGHPVAASANQCAGGLPFDPTPKRWVSDDAGRILSGVEDAHVGSAITCARKTDGTVLCAGDNSHGGLGQGLADSDAHGVPVEVPGLKAAKLVVGGETGCAVVTGKLLCWGDARYGQMPTGEPGTTCGGTGCRPLGLVIDGQDGIRDLSVSTGGIGTIKNDVSVWVWGRNDSGETGVASTDAANTTCANATKCLASPHQMPNVPPLK
jgi:alpha-tubulin suppressor-like RCC1 family protein